MASPRTKTPWLTPAEIVQGLSALYGRPVWRPHGDAMKELILTVLSQNTSDVNSGRAYMRLVSRFPAWEELMVADPGEIEKEIQVGGLAATKAPRIKAILEEVWRGRGSFDLSFLREMPLGEAKAWLRALPGVGPKTAACVLMFALGRPALPVDTHVQRVARRLGLVPANTGAAEAHDLLEAMLAPEDVYAFHVSLIRHGRRLCRAQRPLCAECPLRDRCPTAPLYLGTREAAATPDG
jgi:endonuclease-3